MMSRELSPLYSRTPPESFPLYFVIVHRPYAINNLLVTDII